ncbi:MAG TPA: hypothetical protein VH256_04460 [Thermoleophilaceae bacterium]|jgi:hypothetical protein|nr:hypothetical protein [Thermoleophilaceae bacterium]
MRKLARILLAAALMVGAVAVYASVASGHKGGGGSGNANGRHDNHGQKHRRGQPVLDVSLAPSQVGDPTIHGVAAGGAPWVLDRGEVKIKRDGKFKLRVKGLVIPSPAGNNTPGPVTTVSASLYCGADSDTTAADTTPAVPLSSTGDARIRDDSFNTPSTCLAPVILLHPNGNAAAYIAVDGWRF